MHREMALTQVSLCLSLSQAITCRVRGAAFQRRSRRAVLCMQPRPLIKGRLTSEGSSARGVILPEWHWLIRLSQSAQSGFSAVMIQCAQSGVGGFSTVQALHHANPERWMQSSEAWWIHTLKISAVSHHSQVKRFLLSCKVNIYIILYTPALPFTHTHTHWCTHYSARQAHKLHCITVMPQRGVEMDGHHYEIVQRPSFPWASIASLSGYNQFPVCHLGNQHFPAATAAAGEQKKTRSNVNSQCIGKEKKKKNRTCRVVSETWNVYQSSENQRKTTFNLFRFDEFGWVWLQPATSSWESDLGACK